MDAPVGIFTTTPEGRFVSANRTMARMLGYETPEDLIDSITNIEVQLYANPGDRKQIKEILSSRGELNDFECRWLRRDGEVMWVSLNARVLRDQEDNIIYYQGFATDITQRRQNEQDLRKIEWMLSRDYRDASTGGFLSYPPEPPYDDLTELNTSRVILDAVGKDTLTGIVNDYLEMLDTSAAVYEKNGDYALGIFSSSWCRFMDQASRSLCRTESNKEALACGKWICHESCWETSKQCMETGEPVDKECEGGLRLYTVPVFSGGEPIGAVSFGYGDPPTDMATLTELALKYNVSVDELAAHSKNYESRPPFIIELAKRRAQTAANLIGEIVERKQAEEELKTNYSLLRIAEQIAKFGGWSVDLTENRVKWSDQVAAIHEMPSGYSPLVSEGINFYAPEWRDKITKVFQDCAEKGLPYDEEMEIITATGKRVWVRTIGEAVRDEHGKIIKVQGAFQDISEQKKAEDEQEKLQSQLRQAQKMESVGRLAGGVAHDFNNMLTIINGYAEMMSDILDPADPMYENVREIHDAGKRSAVIVRKLLAFARKQTISPEPMNLNDSVSIMLKMLQRLIGENIDLLWEPGREIWPVMMDISQPDQILANLVVNARDAITDVGKITIETGNVEFDEEYCADHHGFRPGQFVMLAVSDNGCGMSQEVQKNVFEPFFTTKERGKGTGLGLPTVYGILKQNNGFVNIYSEPGRGTTIKMYFPRYLDDADSEPRKAQKPVSTDVGEVVLVLEDDDAVLNLTRIFLEKTGYTVLTANMPTKALDLAIAHEGNIDLLITDVVMPEMSGPDFAEQLKTHYPDIKTLFMSGYTDNVIAHHGILDKGVSFIQKPFSQKDLASKVREVLEY